MRKMVPLISRLALFLGVLGSVLCPCNAVSYVATIQADSEDCFVVLVPRGKKSVISGSFQIEDDEVRPQDFSMSVTQLPQGHVVYAPRKGGTEGQFSFESDLKSTHYSVCFRNSALDDDENAFDVGFAVRVGDIPRAEEDGEIGPETERAFKLVEHAVKIHEQWSVMLDHLDYAHNREAIYEDLASSILHRLAKWTYIEAFLVIGMATGQVMYWKKFFETKRYL